MQQANTARYFPIATTGAARRAPGVKMGVGAETVAGSASDGAVLVTLAAMGSTADFVGLSITLEASSLAAGSPAALDDAGRRCCICSSSQRRSVVFT